MKSLPKQRNILTFKYSTIRTHGQTNQQTNKDMVGDRGQYRVCRVLCLVVCWLFFFGSNRVSGSCSGSAPEQLNAVECEILEKLNYSFESSGVTSSSIGMSGGVVVLLSQLAISVLVYILVVDFVIPMYL